MIKMHQERAKKAIEKCEPELGNIIDSVEKPNSNKSIFFFNFLE